MWAGVILMGLLAGIFPIFRLYEPVQRAEARESQSMFLAARGDELFDGECSACHGAQGLGALAPAIGSRNFLESVEDIQISQLIALGMPGTEMVAYSADYGGPVTSTDIEAITAYLRSLEEESVANPNWRTPLADENLSGKDLYNLACTRCHSLDRTGIEDVAPDISGPPSRWTRATSGSQRGFAMVGTRCRGSEVCSPTTRSTYSSPSSVAAS